MNRLAATAEPVHLYANELGRTALVRLRRIVTENGGLEGNLKWE